MARSPLVVDITPLKRQPGTRRPFRLELPAPADVSLQTAEIAATVLHIELQLEVAGAELVATGTIGVDWVGPCRRCLERQTGRTVVELREIFQRVPVEGETYPLDENDVDLEPMVRETVLLNMPLAPLCADDCPGPDPGRFPTTVVVDAEPDGEIDAAPPADPRWAALRELSFDD